MNYNVKKPKVHVDAHTDCWIWLNSKSSKGYGNKWCATRKRMITAHRWMYERVHGQVDSKLNIDHLCRNRICVNPAHLEAVTPSENTRRAYAYAAAHSEA